MYFSKIVQHVTNKDYTIVSVNYKNKLFSDTYQDKTARFTAKNRLILHQNAIFECV